jgi:hypothetical protein
MQDDARDPGPRHRRGLGVPVGDVGEVEPGQQTIELPRGPLQPAVVGGAFAVAALVTAAALVGGWIAAVPPDLLVLAPYGGAAGFAFVLWAFGRGRPVVLQIRADALVVRNGKERRIVPYADVVAVAAVRRAVHSELLLETRDGRIDRFPVRGFPVAATLEAAIHAAMARSGREAESPDARRALDALRSGRAAEGG